MNSIIKNIGNDIMRQNKLPFGSFFKEAERSMDSFFKEAENFLHNVNDEFTSGTLYNEYITKSYLKNTDTGYILSVTVPGCSSQDVEVFVEDNYLRIKSDKQKFERKYTIPKDVNQDGIAASVQHGLLDITLPREIRDGPKSRKIDIK